jgi:hypothetical protein
MINIVGDINFADGFFDLGFGIGYSIKKHNNPFEKIKIDNKDIWIGNFECVASSKSCKRNIYSYQFRIDPKYLKNINNMHYYNLANNHTMQHGIEAFEETKRFIIESSSKYFGTIDKKSIEFTYKEKRISITSFSLRNDYYNNIKKGYWYAPEIEDIQKEYHAICNNDFKILYVHWGCEFINFPYLDQIIIAHYLIDIGFDIIIGMHPHVIQGYEIYKGKYIFYSIGNFLFNMAWEPTRYGLIVKIDYLNNHFMIDYDYVYIGKDYFPMTISPNKVPKEYQFKYLNNIITKKYNNEEYFKKVFLCIKKYRKANRKYIFKNIYKYNMNNLYILILDFLRRKIKRN